MKIKIKAKHILGVIAAAIAFLFISAEVSNLASYFVAVKGAASALEVPYILYLGNAFAAVSYTHLDVYKRQFHIRDDVSRDQHDTVLGKFGEQIPETHSFRGIKTAGRFVQDQDLRFI